MTIVKKNKDVDFGEEPDAGIKAGYEIVERALKDALDNNNIDEEAFKGYFLEKVHIIHYRVPKDVDLNHYFEVMNSRGEQLEKHEIVKAKLSSQLKNDNKAMNGFCQIWDACSEMSVYIQQKLQKQTGIFGKDMSGFLPGTFDDVCYALNNNDGNIEMRSIESLLDEAVYKKEGKEVVDRNDSYLPIIDFPNFLLIVLKITIMRRTDTGVAPLDIALDDKELIKEFDKVKNLTPDFVKLFAYNLLRAKYFLDNYMVHHINDAERTEENPWKLQIYCNDETCVKRNFFEENGEQKEKTRLKQRELVNLLSMFEVAFTARQRKNYLFYCLLFLFDNSGKDEYLDFVRKLADKYFFDVYLDAGKLNTRKQPKPDSFDKTVIQDGKLNVKLEQEAISRSFNEVYPTGCDTIPLYVFNYTDYRLWKKYADELSGSNVMKGDERRSRFFAELGCSDFNLDTFNHFYFSRTRKSLEHYYPQAKAVKNKENGGHPTLEEINCFGNFAMIGSDANSSGSDWSPKVKREHYLASKINKVSTASLKLMVMMQMCHDNSERNCELEEEWNVDDMRTHQEKMTSIIMRPTVA